MSERRPLLVCSRLTLAAALLVAAGSTGCKRDEPAPSAVASSAAVAPAPRPASSPAVVATASAARPAEKPVDPATRREVAKAVAEGRKLSASKDWAGAVKAFERADALSPNDGRVLADLGFAALQAGDLDKASKACASALGVLRDPSLRAQVLYNDGRIAEARGQKDKAAGRYRESLALRENDTVRKRLAGLDMPAEPEREEPLPCQQVFADLTALCACFADASRARQPAAEPSQCKPAAANLTTPGGELSVAKVGPDFGSEAYFLVIGKVPGGVRHLASLGYDYEPGAFGIHVEAEMKGLEVKTVGGRAVAMYRSVQSNVDQNQGGAEVYADKTERVTFCPLGDASHPPSCPVQTPVKIASSLSYPDFDSFTPEERAEQAEARKHAYSTEVALAFSLDDKGVVTVRHESGPVAGIPRGVVGPHPLF